MTTREVIRDADGAVLAEVCLKAPITDEERAVLVEYFTWIRSRLPEPTPEEEAKQAESRRRNRERLERLGMS